MRLDEFLRTYERPDGKTGLTTSEFAEMAGFSQPQISKLARGVARPSAAAMEAIRKASGGAVTPNDWFQEAAE